MIRYPYYLFCNMLKNQQILHAQAALEFGSFKKAAHAHNISEPAFSRSIANLEHSLGVKLFSRSPNGVQATEFGQILHRYGEKVVDAISELEREIRLLKGLSIGELSVALGPYPAEISCHTALGHLVAEYPDIRCKITVADWQKVEKLVVDHEVDLGIAELSDAEKNKNLVLEPLNKHKFVFYCRSDHPLLRKGTIGKPDFMDYPLVLIRLTSRLSTIFPGRLFPVENSDHAVPSIEIQDIALSKEIIMNSNAIGGVAPYQIRKELAEGQLSVLPINEPWMTLNYGFMYMKDRTLSSVTEKYMSCVRDVESEVAVRNDELMSRYLPADMLHEY